MAGRAVWRTACVAALAAVVGGILVAGTVTDASAADAKVTLKLRAAVDSLPYAEEDRTGYVRTKFHHWIDADDNKCNTRNEVLLAEAVTTPTKSATCSLSGGKWLSYYDNLSWTKPADLDIDHMVPLAEAWDSGASEWSYDEREAYANDLGDDRSLVAVTDNENQSKSDQDPAEWLPPLESARCLYISEWVAVKLRWRLTVDQDEKDALADEASTCTNVTIKVTRAI